MSAKSKAKNIKMIQTPELTRKNKKVYEARVTSLHRLREEIERAEALCKEEEDMCSDAETIDESNDDSNFESESSFESDFIDDSEIDPDKDTKILSQLRSKLNSRKQITSRSPQQMGRTQRRDRP